MPKSITHTSPRLTSGIFGLHRVKEPRTFDRCGLTGAYVFVLKRKFD
jgi:hypothetical protein